MSTEKINSLKVQFLEFPFCMEIVAYFGKQTEEVTQEVELLRIMQILH